GQAAPLGGGDEEARVRHDGAEPERLERDGLPARVRAGDREPASVTRDAEVDGDDATPGREEEWMARGGERNLVGAELGPRAPVAFGERGGGGERVRCGERRLEGRERGGVVAYEHRQLRAHAALARFRVLLREEEPVVQLDGEERL